MSNQRVRSGGRIVVDSFLQHGVEHVFCVPGESYLDILDALVDVSNKINLVSARQEGGAAYMAESYAKLTGKPGVCLVTRSPGAGNAVIAIHTAYQDASPMIILVGQIKRSFWGRGSLPRTRLRPNVFVDDKVGCASRAYRRSALLYGAGLPSR